MAHAIASAHRRFRSRFDAADVLRPAIVAACALALAFAGQPLPFL